MTRDSKTWRKSSKDKKSTESLVEMFCDVDEFAKFSCLLWKTIYSELEFLGDCMRGASPPIAIIDIINSIVLIIALHKVSLPRIPYSLY
jgi:hypothetical protein